MGRRGSRRDGEAMAALVVLLAMIVGGAFRYGWFLLPMIVAFGVAYAEPVFGVVGIAATGIAVAVLWAVRRRASGSVSPVWARTQARRFVAACLVFGPAVGGAIGIPVGISVRREEAEEQAAMQRRAAQEQRDAERSAAEKHAREVAAAAALQQAADRAAAIEAARTPGDRATEAMATLRDASIDAVRAIETARAQLDRIATADRCSADVMPAFRALHDRETQLAHDEYASAMSARMALCCDGESSPSCTCNDIHRGCCSHHGGVCGCEHVDRPSVPALPSCPPQMPRSSGPTRVSIDASSGNR